MLKDMFTKSLYAGKVKWAKLHVFMLHLPHILPANTILPTRAEIAVSHTSFCLDADTVLESYSFNVTLTGSFEYFVILVA